MPIVPQRMVIAATLLALGCASAPPPKTVIVERKVYVFVPERSGPPVPPGPGIAESPLLVAASQHRVEHTNALIAATPPPAPKPTVVYVGDYGYGWRDPNPYVYPSHHHSHEPETKVVVVDHRHDHKHNGKRVEHHDRKRERARPRDREERAADRCSRRGTEFARERCYSRISR